MQIYHELPLCLLPFSNSLSEGEYCLPHLIDKFPQYKEHFIKARENNRNIIMDNGLHEGVNHSIEDLVEKANLIKPDILISQDHWNDSKSTYNSAELWMNVIKPKLDQNINLMVVMQGKNLGEIHDLYVKAKELGYKHFAFNYSSIAYDTLFPHKNPLISKMMGRIHIISYLHKIKVIEDNDYIHLLGASDWREFRYYKGYNFIKSIDSSAPVLNGYNNVVLDPLAEYTKPTIKIEEIMESNLTQLQVDNITHNINLFKQNIK